MLQNLSHLGQMQTVKKILAGIFIYRTAATRASGSCRAERCENRMLEFGEAPDRGETYTRLVFWKKQTHPKVLEHTHSMCNDGSGKTTPKIQ